MKRLVAILFLLSAAFSASATFIFFNTQSEEAGGASRYAWADWYPNSYFIFDFDNTNDPADDSSSGSNQALHIADGGSMPAYNWPTGTLSGAWGSAPNDLIGIVSNVVDLGTTRDFTVGAWFKSGTATRQTIFNNGRDVAGFNGFFVELNIPPAEFRVTLDGGTPFLSASEQSRDWADAAWHHAVFVADRAAGTGTTIRLYMDGLLRVETNTASVLDMSGITIPMFIGSGRITNNSFIGPIDQPAMITNEALSSAQVNEWYWRMFTNHGATAETYAQKDTNYPTMQVQLSMEYSGDTIVDTSLNYMHFTNGPGGAASSWLSRRDPGANSIGFRTLNEANISRADWDYLPNSNGNMTAGMWISPAENNSADERIFAGHYLTTGNQRSWYMAYGAGGNPQTNELRVVVNDTGAAGAGKSFRSLNQIDLVRDTWTHVAFVVDVNEAVNDELKLYINGRLETNIVRGTNNDLSTIKDSTAKVYLGGITEAPMDCVARMDEFFIVNESWTSNKIWDLYIAQTNLYRETL